MTLRARTLIVVIFATAISLMPHRVEAQAPAALDDPLRHGHALLIGTSTYKDPHWPPLDDVPLELEALRKGLHDHFDSVEVAINLETEKLRQRITDFLQSYGNDKDARLFIYYAGHGYTEDIGEQNERRGYITGIDTPWVDGTEQAYNAARPKALSMGAIRAPLEDARAKSILFVFDSCFAGTIFTDRSGGDPRPLSKETVARLTEKPARDFITAGRSDQRVPAHSPIPELLIAAINGAADRYQWGVISAVEIRGYMLDQIRNLDLTPQAGRLDNPAFAEGAFLFRVINPANRAPDENETIRLYRTAADKGDANAQVNLGFLYGTGGGGLPKNDREAARLFKLAADQGNANAQVNLGIFNEEGRGGLPKNDREAARLYKLAADQGNANAQVNLGAFYHEGSGGLPKDDREAARLYKLAADQGDADGQVNLGAFYHEGSGGLRADDREAARLFKLAADQGDAGGQVELGEFYRFGRGGVPKDDREAARLFKLAADQGDAAGQAALGDFYEFGRGGVPKDDREAARLFKLAADQGDADGQVNLGAFYQRGRGGLPKDDREAARLYKLAAKQGNVLAQFLLSFTPARGRPALR